MQKLTYDEAVRTLMALGGELAAPRQPAPVAKFDLRNIATLAAALGSPHRAVPCAHIAGTNGKGSTAAFLASILQHAGLKTGLYTSPHLERINERIRINGEEISDAHFAESFSRVKWTIEALLASGGLSAHPTFFECVTAMAFDCFGARNAGVLAGSFPTSQTPSPSSTAARGETKSQITGEDAGVTSGPAEFAVYEVGLGGRLDSTNIVEPDVCIITPIDFDHENYLGHSIEAIAAEKAGIIKPGVPVVCSAERPEARTVIAQRAAQLSAPLIFVDDALPLKGGIAASFSTPRATDTQFASAAGLAGSVKLAAEVPLRGRFQVRNAAAALAAARVLRYRRFKLSDEAIAHGIAATRWPGRLEKLQDAPLVYLDGTHNPAGARELLEFWRTEFAGRAIHLVFGAVRDKAVDEVAGLLFPHTATVILTAPRTTRAISPETLAQIVAHHAQRVEVIAEPEAALERAIALAGPHDAVFLTGSLYLVGDLRRYWRQR